MTQHLHGSPAGHLEAIAHDSEKQRSSETFVTFSVHHSGTVGQEIVDDDGRIVAWTIDAWTAQVICKLLNENEELLGRRKTEMSNDHATLRWPAYIPNQGLS